SGVPTAAPNPAVPSGGLYVQSDPSSVATTAMAYSAVRFAVPEGSTGTLTLKIAGSPPSTTQTAALSACATTSPWQAPQGGGPGAYDTAPNYDGNKCATGQLSPDGTAYTFALAGKEQPRSGAFDVAIVPTPGSPPAPFAVVFNPPD